MNMSAYRLSLLFAALAIASNASAELPLRQQVVQEAEKLAPQTAQWANALWEYSETAHREKRSAALLVDALKKEGFTIETGVAGLPTAFIASYGQGKPIIGILA